MNLETLNNLFKEADEAAKNSDDAETKVGAVLYWISKDRDCVAHAANTFINGAKNLPNTRPDKYQYIVHAEANLMYAAAARGLAIEGFTVVCTLSPCQNCIRSMFQSGIREIYYRDRYHSHNPEMLDIKVIEESFGPYTKMILTNHEEA